MTSPPQMLDGLRVLDLSRVIAGPHCAMLLGDLGADVIKLERPGRGDDLRGLRGDGQMGAVFAASNRNKRGVAVDLGRPEGRALALALARRADVVVENFLPGVAERLGLGYAAVAAEQPTVVYVSVSGFGQTGPSAQRPGYNTIAQGMSGLMALTGMPGHPPTRVAGSVSDLAAAYMAFGAVNAALVHRFRTGRGQHLDVSLLASSLSLLPDPTAIYFESGVRPRREGNRNPNLSPAEAFKTADGWMNVVIMNPEQWERFCGALGDPDMATDPRFATNADRVANHEAFKARVEAILATATNGEWVPRLVKAQIAAGPVYEFDEVFEDPQVRHLANMGGPEMAPHAPQRSGHPDEAVAPLDHRYQDRLLGLVTELEQPGYGRYRVLGFPFRASATPATVRRPAPRLGEHTREVLEELGIAAEEIDRLAAAGVIALG